MAVIRVERRGDIAEIVIDNPPVNATSTALRAALLQAVSDVQDARLAVLRCAGRTFVAGGDMTEFDRPVEEPHLPDVVDAIEVSKAPILALLHGNVLGGGLEIAMACAWRVARPGTRFGLPEVNVGLIPGAGGTQRAPRLIGWDAAIDMACSGKILSAEDMLELGGIDAITEDFDRFVRQFDEPRPLAVSRRDIPPLDKVDEHRDRLARKARGQKAPLHNLTALQWAALPYEDGQPRERALHLDLRQSAESRALRHVFFAERSVGKPSALSGGAAKPILVVAVVGGGLMGAGISAACLFAGYIVRLIERDADAAQSAQARIETLLDGALKRGKTSAAAHAAQRDALSVHDNYAAAAGADLAIEAVFEDLGTKQQVFADLSAVVAPETLLATNTSYLDPREIFAATPNPSRCLGLHFFSPAHIMRLVEIIRLPDTSVDALTTGFSLAKSLRKVAVLSGICDGFIGNRILSAYRRAAEYMLADGALPQDVDTAMRAFGMAMGPFEAQDMAGLQIAEANRRRQDATRPAAERYVAIADQLCAAGRYGQRAGRGWYRYAEGSRTPRPDPEVAALIEAYSGAQGLERRDVSSGEIQTGLLAAMANEGARIVEEGIAEADASVDIVKIHGYGFPRWRGGPMHAAGAFGQDAIRAALDALDTDSPGSWIRAQRYV